MRTPEEIWRGLEAARRALRSPSDQALADYLLQSTPYKGDNEVPPLTCAAEVLTAMCDGLLGRAEWSRLTSRGPLAVQPIGTEDVYYVHIKRKETETDDIECTAERPEGR